MRYKEEPGIAYDTVFYGAIFFNGDNIIKKFKNLRMNTKDVFIYYNEINNTYNNIPEYLLPFFYYDTGFPSFLTTYLTDKVNFHEDNIKTFFNFLKNNKEVKNSILDFLFVNIPQNEKNLIFYENNSEKIYRVIQDQNWDLLMKSTVIFMIYNFDFVLAKLIESLEKIYKLIKVLHSKHQILINKKIEESASPENLALYSKSYALNNIRANKQYFSLSFLNPFVITSKSDGYCESVFLMGIRHKELLEEDCKTCKIKLEEALSILGDPIRYKMVECLKKHGKLTASDLSRLTNISVSTASRDVNTLVEQRIIKEEHTRGRRIFYSINPEYIITLERLMNEYFDAFQINKGG